MRRVVTTFALLGMVMANLAAPATASSSGDLLEWTDTGWDPAVGGTIEFSADCETNQVHFDYTFDNGGDPDAVFGLLSEQHGIHDWSGAVFTAPAGRLSFPIDDTPLWQTDVMYLGEGEPYIVPDSRGHWDASKCYTEVGVAGGTAVVSDSVLAELEGLGADPARYAGPNRYATAAALVERGFPNGYPTALVATGENWPDALMASQTARPILLTRTNSLPVESKAALAKLDPNKVYIIGGTGVVSAAVEAELRTLVPEVERLGGRNRFETAEMVVNEFIHLQYLNALVVTPNTYPDALGAGAIAGGTDGTMVIYDGPNTPCFMRSHGIERIYFIGGTGVIPASREAEYRSIRESDCPAGAPWTFQRVWGPDRYATAAAVADELYVPEYPPMTAFLATGENFPDGLVAGALGARFGVPLLLTRNSALPGVTKTGIQNLLSD